MVGDHSGQVKCLMVDLVVTIIAQSVLSQSPRQVGRDGRNMRVILSLSPQQGGLFSLRERKKPTPRETSQDLGCLRKGKGQGKLPLSL